MNARSVFTQVQFGLARHMVTALMVGGVMSVLVVKSGQRDFSEVQVQVEGAAIKASLGGLRTAFVIDYLARQLTESQGPAPAAMHAAVQANPFLLLHRMPSNYAGERPAADISTLQPGNWLFDARCTCIGYRPLYPQWLNSPSGSGVLWFDVRGAPGPLQLVPRETYLWHGELLS
ncbi:MAG: hypothetical protein Q8K45_01000 [Rubrivivax sp.]|nr:hypothetical protein [Hylemonella sp.]MDP2004225.1 hypothetical protein [Rubrivivax sp.]